MSMIAQLSFKFKLLRRQHAVALLIVVFAAAIALGYVLTADVSTATENASNWILPAGTGLVAPACSSSGSSVTCSEDGKVQATITWEEEFTHNVEGEDAIRWRCQSATVTVDGFDPVVYEWEAGGCAAGSHTQTGLEFDSEYNYTIVFKWVLTEGGLTGTTRTDTTTGTFTTPSFCPINPGKATDIRGYKIGSDGRTDSIPSNITISAEKIDATGADDGYKSTRTDNPYAFEVIPAGKYRVETEVPAGYVASYSECVNCTNHPASSYRAGSSATVSAPAGGYVDLWWKYERTDGGPSASLTCSPNNISAGGSAQLRWACANASAARINQGVGSLPFSPPNDNGTETVSPSADTLYTLFCEPLAGSSAATASDSCRVTVGDTVNLSITANPPSILRGESSTVSWSATGAIVAGTCRVSKLDSSGTAPWRTGASGSSNTGALEETTIYTLTCNKQAGGSASKSASVSVRAINEI